MLRFLNNCSGDEMKAFVELITQSFREIFDGKFSSPIVDTFSFFFFDFSFAVY